MKAAEFSNLIAECCEEVLDAMYFTSLLDSEQLEIVAREGTDESTTLAFSLRFAGDISGRFGVWLKAATARSLAANFLGEEETDISSAEAGEVAGELANMFCGSVMSRVEGEHKFVPTHPEAGSQPLFVDGDDFCVCRLSSENGLIMVWVVVEGEPCAP